MQVCQAGLAIIEGVTTRIQPVSEKQKPAEAKKPKVIMPVQEAVEEVT